MRTLNYRFLGWLLLAAALISAGAYFAHGYQVKRHADVLLREAESAREREDWNQAIEYLERYVLLVPRKNVVPLADLGFLLADQRRIVEAYRTFENVLRQDSSRDDVRRRLVAVALDLRRYPDARHHAAILLERSPGDAELLAFESQALAAMAEYPAAAAALEKAIESAPDKLELHARLASLLQGPLKDAAQAGLVLDRMVAEN